MSKFKTTVDPLKGSIIGGILRFSLPLMLVQLLQVLFSVSDTVVIGRFGEEGAMSSIGVCGSLISLVISLGIGLSSGVSVIIGEAYGEGDKDKVHRVLQALPLSGMVIGACLSLIAIFAAPFLFTFTEVPESLLDNALLYFRIYFSALPLSVAFAFLSAAVQAKGDTFHPLLFQLGAGLLNLLLNLLFVIVFRWNVFGVAIATVMSQVFSFVAIIIFLLTRKDEQKLILKELRMFKGLGKVFSIGIPGAVSWCIMDVSNVLIQRAVNTFEELAIEGNTASSSLEGLMFIAFAGFGTAATVFVSQNYGARNFERVRKSFWTVFLLCVTMGETIGPLVYLFGDKLLGIYKVHPEAMEAGLLRLQYMGLFYGFCGTMNSLNGCIRGLKYPITALLISVCCAGVFRVTWVLWMNKYVHTLASIYVAYPICWIMSTVLCLIFFLILCRRREKEHAMVSLTD